MSMQCLLRVLVGRGIVRLFSVDGGYIVST